MRPGYDDLLTQIADYQAELTMRDQRIDALTAELKASEWVRKDNSLRTYDGLTEENQRLRESMELLKNDHMFAERFFQYEEMLKLFCTAFDSHAGLITMTQIRSKIRNEFKYLFQVEPHSDDAQAAPRCKHDIHGNDCVKCYPSEVE